MEATLGLERLDPNNDGKLRLDELFDITDDFSHPEQLFCMFDITGEASLTLEGTAEFLGVGGMASLDAGTDESVAFLDSEGGTLESFAPPDSHGRYYRTDQADGSFLTLEGAQFVKWEVDDDSDAFLTVASGGNYQMQLDGGLGNDSLFGGDGNDILVGLAGQDQLYGDDGDDSLDGGDGDDQLDGGNDDDTLTGANDADPLFGGRGNDLVRAGVADPMADGNGGDDTAVFDVHERAHADA